MAAASIIETRAAIDKALGEGGPPFSGYSCKTVSWDDVSRGTVNGSLSCWGANITDTYLTARDGTRLFTVRPDNWDERLGVVRATDVALLVGNCEPPPSSSPSPSSARTASSPSLRNVTLHDFLKQPAASGAAYANFPPDVSLLHEGTDDKVSIRFQTVFLPVPSGNAVTGRQTMEFATEAYNYNTRSDADPRNLVILATTQGVAVQADGEGKKALLHHERDAKTGKIYNCWLEAERSDHGVGGEQVETKEEKKDALERGKATADVLGIRAMGKRFNTLMTIQVPLQVPKGDSSEEDCEEDCEAKEDIFYFGTKVRRQLAVKSARRGVSNAARVSRGKRHGIYRGLSVEQPRRNSDEHVTVTVVFYNTVAGGVPTAADVIAAVEDMENLLSACSESGRLANAAFDFMKKELTVKDMGEIQLKIADGPSTLDVVDETGMADTDGPQVGEQTVDEQALIQQAVDKLFVDCSLENVSVAKLMAVGALPGVEHDVVCTVLSVFDELAAVASPGPPCAEIGLKIKRVKLVVAGALKAELSKRVSKKRSCPS